MGPKHLLQGHENIFLDSKTEESPLLLWASQLIRHFYMGFSFFGACTQAFCMVRHLSLGNRHLFPDFTLLKCEPHLSLQKDLEIADGLRKQIIASNGITFIINMSSSISVHLHNI